MSFEKAEKIVEEYHKLKLDKKAKDNFNFHDKLKDIGYTKKEYFRECLERKLKNLDLSINYCDVDDILKYIHEGIISKKQSILFNIPTKVGIYTGSDNFNEIYCKKNNISILHLGYQGGTIVFSESDLGIALFLNDEIDASILRDKLSEYISKNFKTNNIDKTDILINGYKVAGITPMKKGNKFIYLFQISYSVNLDLIKNICTKEMKKTPKGLNNYGVLTRSDLILEVKSWLQ